MLVSIAAGAALLAACGSSGSSGGTTAAPATQAPATTTAPATEATEAPATTASSTPATTAAAGAAPVTVAKTALGDILVDAKGFTLYAFTNDSNGTSTCTGGCAQAWPPATVASEDLPAGLDPKVFSVVEGPDETYQLKAGSWPLYTYAGDQAAGDVNGEGSGGKWFVVAPDGSLIKGS
jgi:predicted lipoprotein with Yx(FWY)xxD motif